LLGNPNEVCEFISELKRCFQRHRSVFIRLTDVQVINSDALLVLLSVLIRFKSNNIEFKGNRPKNKNVYKDLLDSGFFEYLYQQEMPQLESYNVNRTNRIVSHGDKNVDAELGAELIKSASKTVWGEERLCPGVQRVLIELMHNTNNHAVINKKGGKHWWVSVTHYESKVAFSFVDYGVGIFSNLINQKKGKFFLTIRKMFKKNSISAADQIRLLEEIFSGKLHYTATNDYYRGKGLPGIYNAYIKNRISNLALITNEVYFSSNNNVTMYQPLSVAFNGTFVYWELNNECHSVTIQNK
jgi:hypothetical protein